MNNNLPRDVELIINRYIHCFHQQNINKSILKLVEPIRSYRDSINLLYYDNPYHLHNINKAATRTMYGFSHEWVWQCFEECFEEYGSTGIIVDECPKSKVYEKANWIYLDDGVYCSEYGRISCGVYGYKLKKLENGVDE